MKRARRFFVGCCMVLAFFFASGARGEEALRVSPPAVDPASPASGDGLAARLEAVRLQGLCLLDAPDARASTRKVLRAGEVVRVVSVADGWVEIAVRGEVRGFVQAGYLTGFSGDVPAPYRDRLVRVSRRPGKNDAVGSLVEAGPSAWGAPPETESVPDRERTELVAGRSSGVQPAQSDLEPAPETTLRSGVPESGGVAGLPVPDPGGVDRFLATVLEDMKRPSGSSSAERLDAAARAYYERKNRYAVEVFLADCKLVLYEKLPDGGRRPARTFQVATPAGDVEPPQGWGVITQIEFEPWWRPTENMKRRARQKGRSLPDVMPPGKQNPMGPFKMHLSHGDAFRIHGNNDPKSIGRKVTNGCIRMRNDEGMELARILDVGTEVVFSEHAPSSADNQRPGP